MFSVFKKLIRVPEPPPAQAATPPTTTAPPAKVKTWDDLKEKCVSSCFYLSVCEIGMFYSLISVFLILSAAR